MIKTQAKVSRHANGSLILVLAGAACKKLLEGFCISYWCTQSKYPVLQYIGSCFHGEHKLKISLHSALKIWWAKKWEKYHFKRLNFRFSNEEGFLMEDWLSRLSWCILNAPFSLLWRTLNLALIMPFIWVRKHLLLINSSM